MPSGPIHGACSPSIASVSSSSYLDAVYCPLVKNCLVAIQSFSDQEAEGFFIHGRLKKGNPWQNASSIVRRKLDMLHYAAELEDLRSPPGNRLEALKGKLARFHSIRVNDQWRVVFVWTRMGPERVSVQDYHR